MAKAPAAKAPKKDPPPPPVEEDDVGEKGGGAKDEGKGEEKRKPPVVMIAAIVGALVLGIAGGVVVMKLMGGHPAEPPAEAHAEAPAEAEHAPPPAAPQRGGGHGQAAAAEPSGHGGGSSGGHGGAPEEAPPPIGALNVEFSSFIANLNDVGGRRMLKLTMSVEADTQELSDEINAKMPKLRDTILLLLSSIQSDDVSGLDGKQRLKTQMKNRINQNLTRGKIQEIYFSEVVVQ